MAKQERLSAKQRFDDEKVQSVQPSEQELWEMPLEDLRRLDAIEAQKKMQRRGVEGAC